MLKKKIKSTDLYRLKQVSNPQISPDGMLIAYTYHFINEKNKYRTELHLIDSNSKKCLKKISDSSNNHSQKWSPDGQTIAYISNKTGTEQIWLLKIDENKAEQLTTMRQGVSCPEWSSDGKKLLFLSTTAKGEDTEKLISEKNAEEIKKEKEDNKIKIKVINKKFYKLDGVGFFDERNPQVWIVDIETKKYNQITYDSCNHQSPVWSEDGNKIAFVKSIDQDTPGYHPLKSELWIYDINSNKLNCLIKGDIAVATPSFSPDGKNIAYLSHDIKYGEASFYKLWTVDLESGEKSCLTASADMALGNWGLNDVSDLCILSKPIWNNDGINLYFTGSDHGNVEIYTVSLDGNLKKIISGHRQIGQFSLDAAKRNLVFNFSSPLIPGDISLFDLEENNETRLTEINKELLDNRLLSMPEEFCIKGKNGHDISGWIMKPVPFDESEKYPAILEIHGGPHLMYANSFFFEFQFLASSGYVVIYSNPCGSMGYGQEFADMNRGDYGNVDYQDLMDVTEYIRNLLYVDNNRIGVTGGSYGGYMTNWIVTQTQQFTAAVTQRSISNLFTHAGVSDDGMFTSFIEHKASLDNMGELYRNSPITYIDRVKTPLLFIHSENDYRCPLEQAEQMYVNLKFRERITELVIYPNSSHGLSRNGFPPFRVDRLQRIRDWFDCYMKDQKTKKE